MKTKTLILFSVTALLIGAGIFYFPFFNKYRLPGVQVQAEVPKAEAQEKDLKYSSYTLSIPEGPGDLTELNSYGGENWFSLTSDSKEVPVGSNTYDQEGNILAIDQSKGSVKIDSLSDLLIDPTANRLSWKNNGLIQIKKDTWNLEGGERAGENKQGQAMYSELRASYQDYVYGTGKDLYQLENTSQGAATQPLSHIHGITRVRIYANIEGKARTLIKTYGQLFSGNWVNTKGLTFTEYQVNPSTNQEWTWQEIDDLQAGIELDNSKSSSIYVEVEAQIGTQTFYWVTPIECTPGRVASWQDVDLDNYVSGLGSDVTGVILHVEGYAAPQANFGLRKNGSSDNYLGNVTIDYHYWGFTGVDSDHIFEVYYNNSVDSIHLYIVGYTTTGVTFFTNAYNKTPANPLSWQDADCSSEAPNAIGLIWQTRSNITNAQFGYRNNGSTDNRYDMATNCIQWAIIGCDASQITEIYRGMAYGGPTPYYTDHYLMGYVTAGATFYTNATDLSLGTTGAWTDLSALPSNAGGFIEVYGNGYYANGDFGLRKNGSSEDIYRYNNHSWGFIESDGTIIEGKIENTNMDFFLVGYAEAPPGINISGTSDLTDCTGCVAVAVDSSIQGQTGNISSGSWSISGVSVSVNNIVTVFNNGTSDDTTESTAVTKYDGTENITGMVLNANVLSLGSDDAASLVITDLSNYTCVDDEDVMQSVASSELKVEGTNCFGSVNNSYSDEGINVITTSTPTANTLTVGNTEILSTHNLSISYSGSTYSSLISGTSSVFNVSGSWNNDGVFTSSSGTVIFDGAAQQTLSGTMTGASAFNTLVVTNNSGTDPVTDPSVIFSASATAATSTITTASVKVRFLASGTYTFTNINWNGQATGTRLALRSSSPGTQWNLVVTGTQTVSNTDSKDSNASGGDIIDATDGTNLSSGNNSNWNFSNPTITSVSDSPDPQQGGSTVSFASVASDPDVGDTIKLYLCKAADCASCSSADASNCWAVTAAGVTTNPSASYTSLSCTVATNNYWAKVCDIFDTCSSITAGVSFSCLKETSCPDTAAANCFSTFSSDGYCCDLACTGTCQRCDATLGTCVLRAAEDNTECPAGYRCDGTNTSCQIMPSEKMISQPILRKEKPIYEMIIGEVQFKISEVLKKIAELKIQLLQISEKETLEIPPSYKFIHPLYLGLKNNAVRYLQIFLKSREKELYPEGLITGYFGPLTEKAIISFQLKYNLITSEKDIAAGYVGPKTRAKINEILGR